MKIHHFSPFCTILHPFLHHFPLNLHHCPLILHHFTPFKPVITEKYVQKSWGKFPLFLQKLGQNVLSKMSLGQNVSGAKCPLAVISGWRQVEQYKYTIQISKCFHNYMYCE